MSILDHLWDDTVAGPPPENGLGRLRKYSTFNSRSASGNESGGARSIGEDGADDAIRVTRKITIVKPPGYQVGSPPVSPAGSASLVSPFPGGKESFRFRRRSTSDAVNEKANGDRGLPSSPYDV